MSLKIHYLHSHLDFFPENLALSELFRQILSAIEQQWIERRVGSTNDCNERSLMLALY